MNYLFDRICKALIMLKIFLQECFQKCSVVKMSAYFDNKGKKGYDYAYRYPGMNRVLQAAGRVIRTRDDRGLILLLDDRFLLHENQALLPEDWDSFYEVSLRNCGEVIRNFYSVTGD